MKVIELFSGNADITKYLKAHGINCVSVDYVKSYNDFLGRCKMPESLIKDIYKTILVLGIKGDTHE